MEFTKGELEAHKDTMRNHVKILNQLKEKRNDLIFEVNQVKSRLEGLQLKLRSMNHVIKGKEDVLQKLAELPAKRGEQ